MLLTPDAPAKARTHDENVAIPAVEPVPVALPRIPPAQRFVTLGAVIVPLLGLIGAIFGVWGWGFTWAELGLLVGMYAATVLGVTVGFHRLFTHRSFETIRPVKLVLAILGSMSVQGPLFKWVAVHRRHHQYSDEVNDPHSPHGHGGGAWGVIAGWFHAHIGWMFRADPPDLGRYVRDLRSDRVLHAVSRTFSLWVILGLLIPAMIGALIAGTWTGALLGFLWGGLARIFLAHHVTWSINSICHMWGRRTFESRDHSRNNFICGVIAFGEGWHNNHHAFPTSARHGLRWWEVDMSYAIIYAMKLVGLAWRVRVPAAEAIAIKRIRHA